MTWEGLSPPYSTVVVDPPWHYSGFAGSVGYGGRFAGVQGQAAVKVKPLPYTSMSVDAIAAMPVRDLIGSSGWLWLWTTSRYLPDAFGIVTAWGFTYRQIIVWRKTGNPPPFGGTVAPPHAEFLLLAAVGSPARVGRSPSSVVEAPKQSVHSHKPAVFLDLIEATTPGPYVELFARAPRLGWDSWGRGYEVAPNNTKAEVSDG
jgi:N6-adenosine-specific RNA methylase IME4